MRDHNTELSNFLGRAKELRRRPTFQPALRRYAMSMLRMYRGTPVLNKVVNEHGRFLISSLALQLHLHRDPTQPGAGLTLSRLRELCTQHGIASTGRVTAFLALMRLAGFLVPASDARDRRAKVLVPTERMMAHVRLFTAVQFKAIDTLYPASDHSQRLEREPGFLEDFHRAAGGYFLRGCRLPDAFPEMDLFIAADAGYMVLMALFLQLPTVEGRAVPGTVDMPHGASARRFGVSRSHMANLMRGAEQGGFLVADGSGGRGLRVNDTLVDLVERWFAAQMALMAQSAADAIAGTARMTIPVRGSLGAGRSERILGPNLPNTGRAARPEPERDATV